MISTFLVSNIARQQVIYKYCYPSSHPKYDIASLNCSDHKLTQLLINRPVAVPSTSIYRCAGCADSESDMSDILLLLEIDLNSHRLFILAIDLQYSAPSEIILTWNLKNLTICITVALKFQKTTKTSRRNISYRVVVLVFLGFPQMQCACVTLCDEKEGMHEPALHIPRWPLDQSEY